jgi:4-amino-4-deoxy-L-arabinose transferase-like glycosyltransferase
VPVVPGDPPRSSAAPDAGGSTERVARRPRLWLAGLFLLALALAAPGNGASRPIDAHEVFVARTATEMARRGEWLVPWFNGEVRLQKPPLAYWLVMLTHDLAGGDPGGPVAEWEARAYSVLSAALLAVLVALLGWAVFERLAVGAVAGALFATSYAYLMWARTAQAEMLYALCAGIELLGFVLAWRWRDDARRARFATLLAWAGFSAAVLAKGPFVPLFFLAGAALGLALSDGWRWMLAVVRPALGALVVTGLVVPYFVALQRREPQAFGFWLAQMFDRTGGVEQAWWRPLEFYYPIQAFKLCLPWSLLLPAAVYWFRRGASAPVRMIGGATLATLLCLSFSAGQKGYYLLPIVPLLLLLGAGSVAAYLEREGARAFASTRALVFVRAHATALALGALALLAATWLRRELLDPAHFFFFPAQSLFLLALGAALLAWRARGRANARGATLVFGGTCCLVLAVAVTGIGWRLDRFTDAEFAREVGRALAPDDGLVVVDGNQQVLLHYADHEVRAAESAELPREVAGRRPKVVLLASRLARGGLQGRILVRERLPAGGDALVLLDPRSGPADAGTSPPRSP